MTTSPEEIGQGQARILSNTTYLLAASVIQKFISFGYVVYYFRLLGRAGTGDFEPVRSAIPIALLLIDLSLSTVLTREIGRAPERALRYFGNVLTIKVITACTAAIGLFFVYLSAPFDPVTKTLIPIASLVVALDMFTTTFTAVLRGLQVFLYEAIGIVLTQLMTVAVGILSFQFHWGLRGLMFSLAAGGVVNFVFILSMLKRKLGSFPQLALHRDVVRKFFLIAAPIFGAALLAKLFTYTDRYLLLTFANKSAFAIYAAAHKVPFALEFIAAAFAASMLPAMSRYYVTAQDNLSRVFQQSIRYLLMISIPIAIGILVLAQPLVTKLLGKTFLDSILPLRIMILALPFIFLNYPVGSFLIATNRQIWNTINLGIAVVINVSLNVFLQPHYRVEGAAIAVVVTYIVLFTLGLFQVSRVIRLHSKELLRLLARVSAAAAVMAIPIWLLQRTFSPYFLIIPGVILYGAALFLTGGLRRTDVQLALRIFTRKAS